MSVSSRQSYEEFKSGLPDIGWLHSILPSNESVDAFRGNMIKFKDKFRDSFSGFEFGESCVRLMVRSYGLSKEHS